MAKTVFRNADVVVTMDDARREIRGGDVLVENGKIVAVGENLPRADAEIVEAGGCVITPGLVNTHHHLFQTLTRAVPAAQDAALFGWLRTLYPIWSRMTPDDIRLSAEVGLAELALSGCTCSSDHLYLFPNGSRLDDSIEAARKVGIRFTATRGAMSIGESKGGLPPDALVEDEAAILADSERVVDAFHDAGEGGMVQVGLAPCSPFSVSREL
uniref:amidohydrolase family protein n=1 Tax=Paracoccus sp. TaxID=267 RepID=UPI0035B22DC5